MVTALVGLDVDLPAGRVSTDPSPLLGSGWELHGVRVGTDGETVRAVLSRQTLEFSGGFLYVENYSLVRLPFLARVLEYRTSRMVPMTPAEIALVRAATRP